MRGAGEGADSPRTAPLDGHAAAGRAAAAASRPGVAVARRKCPWLEAAKPPAVTGRSESLAGPGQLHYLPVVVVAAASGMGMRPQGVGARPLPACLQTRTFIRVTDGMIWIEEPDFAL
jgi:hypothetical protein